MAAIPERQQPEGDASGDNAGFLVPFHTDKVDWKVHYRTYCGLPPRERQVCDLFGQGFSIKEIADRLGSSAATVRVQLANLRRKFAVESSHKLAICVTRTLYEKNRPSKQND